MKQTRNHPSSETLAAFGQGRLPPAEQADVEQHIAECDACCQALRGIPNDTLLDRLRDGSTHADTPVAPAAPAPAKIPAELVDHPRYRVVRVLGAGGMGVVYQAEHRLMERTVALKVVSRQLTSNPTAVERFRREVKAAARLAHPNIVTAHDAEQAGDLHFLVMEYVDGVSLARLVEQRGPLAVTTACQCIRQAALGLQHAHENGMVHRDIKPQNLMLTRKGQLKILDFGLARLGRLPGDDRPATALRLTALGTVLGTPDYLAPEQARDSRSADIRSDIYSLGGTLYFLLAGHPPFPTGTPYEKVFSHLENAPMPLQTRRPETPAEVIRILERMMAKDPTARFQTPAEVAEALAPFTKPLTKSESSPPVSTRPRSRRLLTLVGWAALLMMGLALLGWAVVYFNRAPIVGGVPVATSPRVLLVVTQSGVWAPDYDPVAERLKASAARVTVASWAGGESTVHDSGRRIHTDRPLAECRAEEFDAIVFVGSARIDEYTGDGPGRTQAIRLLDEARHAKPPRVVGGLCAGVAVLADAGILNGKSAARPLNPAVVARPEINRPGISWDRNTPVVVDGTLLTGSDERDADAFARKLLEVLRSNADISPASGGARF